MGYNSSKQARRRRKRRKRILEAVLPIAIAVVLIGLIALLSFKFTDWFDDFSYSSKKADLYEYFGVTEEDGDKAVIVENGEPTADRITVKDGRLYVPYEDVIAKYNDNFYWQAFDEKLLYTTGDGVYSATPGENYYSLEGNGIQAGYPLCYMDGQILMVCLDYVKTFTNFEYSLFGGNKEPYRAEVKTEWGTKVVADVNKDKVCIRTKADKEGDVLKELRKGSTVVIDDSENEKWMKVTSDDLITGYIETKHLGDKYDRPETAVNNVEPITVTPVADYSAPLVLAWHNVTGDSSMSSLKDNEKYLSYINTISPTWFSLADNEGTIESLASSSYVETCHAKNVKVWGLVSNLTHPEVGTSEVLADPAKRAFVTEQLLNYAAQFNLDGINIDFESVAAEDGPAFVQFVREFTLKAHEKGLVVSVDNYVPKEYTRHYDRQEQGIFADYVIIMGYDEHTSSSEEAGSVASLDFVLEGIENTLNDVPKEKVINALPFYTRSWKVDENGVIADVQALPMATAQSTVDSAGVTPVWDDATGQNYAEWQSDGATNKIWLEDVKSLQAKLEVMKAHDIGGVAIWQLAFSTDEALSVVDGYYPPAAASGGGEQAAE
ncbi:MAG: chitinase [Lachnospiraceae bacterium]|nr:chitinase [Lachnospiraceae bacterium]